MEQHKLLNSSRWNHSLVFSELKSSGHNEVSTITSNGTRSRWLPANTINLAISENSYQHVELHGGPEIHGSLQQKFLSLRTTS